MRVRHINRATSVGLIVLSLTALLAVLSGYTQPRLPDEGAAAHIFQLSFVALMPMAVLFLATADRTRPSRITLPLAFSGAASGLALVALYFLEHSQ